MAGIRAGKGLKVSNFEFTAISDEFPSPLWIFRECEYATNAVTQKVNKYRTHYDDGI